MSNRFLPTATLIALSVFSTFALADTPANVGRVSLAQGQVSIDDELGGPPNAALVNWPVTSHNQITTARGARTEFRIGSTAVRLDGDSSLEIEELDDGVVRLHLNYGSAFIRVRSQDVLRGFELTTPQARVHMLQPGRVRIEAERQQDTSIVNVFDGAAEVDTGATRLTVHGGRRADIVGNDVRTALAVHDGFDDWAMLRDQRDDRAVSARYVTREMTGYEDLDQYGMWSEDPEYGPLWLPRAVPVGWAPYRDGRWTWIDPWGWTWVDNAPWGYAPSHYGRWVMVNRRWCWAPGRQATAHPVWAPALVGWIGGSNWSLSFNSGRERRYAPAQGWYPLTPRDSYVPSYQVSQQHLQQINRFARPDGRRDQRHRDDNRRDDNRREGLTVVPHDQFGHRGTVMVQAAPKAIVPPMAWQQAPVAAPPAPQGIPHERGQRDARTDSRFERDATQRRFGQQPGRVLSAPPAAGVPVPGQQSQAFPRDRANERDGRDGRFQRDGAQQRPGQPQEQGRVLTAPPAVGVPVPGQQQAFPRDRANERDGRDGRFQRDGAQQRPGQQEQVRVLTAPPAAIPAPVPHPAGAIVPAPPAAQPPVTAAPVQRPGFEDRRRDGRAGFEGQRGGRDAAPQAAGQQQRDAQQQARDAQAAGQQQQRDAQAATQQHERDARAAAQQQQRDAQAATQQQQREAQANAQRQREAQAAGQQQQRDAQAAAQQHERDARAAVQQQQRDAQAAARQQQQHDAQAAAQLQREAQANAQRQRESQAAAQQQHEAQAAAQQQREAQANAQRQREALANAKQQAHEAQAAAQQAREAQAVAQQQARAAQAAAQQQHLQQQQQQRQQQAAPPAAEQNRAAAQEERKRREEEKAKADRRDQN